MLRNTREQYYTSAFDNFLLLLNVFFCCKKRDRQQKKKEEKKRTEKKELMYKIFKTYIQSFMRSGRVLLTDENPPVGMPNAYLRR